MLLTIGMYQLGYRMDGFNRGSRLLAKGPRSNLPAQADGIGIPEKEMDMRLRVCGSKGLKNSFAGVLLFSGGQFRLQIPMLTGPMISMIRFQIVQLSFLNLIQTMLVIAATRSRSFQPINTWIIKPRLI
jgi:hypothetical protein